MSSHSNDLQALVQGAFQAASKQDWVVSEQLCKEAMAADPNNADALHLMALTCKLSGRIRESLPYYQRVVDLHPKADFLPTVLCNYANALRECKEYVLAESCFSRAISLNPGYVDAYSNLGLVLQEQGRYVDAKRYYLKALSLNPDYADGWNNLGGVFQKQGELQEAHRAYVKALALRPVFPQAHYNIGNVLADGGLLPEAVEHYRISLDQDPDYIESAISWLRQAQNMCRWGEVKTLSERLKRWVQERHDGRIFPFAFIGIETNAQEQFECGKQWADNKYLTVAAGGNNFRFSQRGTESSRLRIGYLSSDFHNHATAYLLAEVIELHDREKFEIYAYSAGADDGKDMRKRLQEAFDHFIDIQHDSYESAARRINADKIDILVDLKGYTRDTRAAILAFHPAPIQVSYLGYPGTLGAKLADYVITDSYITPPEYIGDFCEKLIYLSDTYQPNDRSRKIGNAVTRSEVGLPDDVFVFCCFNHTYKITPEIFATWCRLLCDLPNSVLWLLQSNQWAEENLRHEALARGIAPDRLIFAPERPLPDHLARVRLADLFLDTLPVNAHTTASDALWAGLPVLTLSGETFISRVAGSLLHAVGLDDLISSSVDDYTEKALSLARCPMRIKEIKNYLEANKMDLPLFDAVNYTKNLENAYMKIWDQYKYGIKEHSID